MTQLYGKTPVVRPRLMEFSAQVVADHDHQILYVFPPKCAQTSLRKYVGPLVESPVRFDKARKLVHEDDYLTVMSVRNPYHRFVSAWRNKFPNVPFEVLLHHVLDHGDMALDIHLQSQCHLLDLAGIDEPDHFLRVGPGLVEDVAIFSAHREWLQWIQLAHENKTGAGMGDFLTCDNDTIKMFQWRYRADFELWEIANG